MNIHLRPFQPQDVSLIQTWLSWPEEQIQKWIDYVLLQDNYWGWIIYLDKTTIGHACYEVIDSIAHVGIEVHKDYQNKGHGTEVLQMIIDKPESRDIKAFQEHIEPDNSQGIRCFEKAGFVKKGEEVDEEGFLTFELTATNS